jgi:DNA-binding CsgD family transcriptional regulator
MSGIVWPKKQLNHKYINDAIDKWLDIHFGDTSFNGRAVIGHRRNGGGIYTMTARSLTELRPYVKMIHASSRLDYYITANTVKGTKREKSELFGLQNIVIDIDCHSKEHQNNVSSLVEAFIWRCKRDLFGEGVIPFPNSIVRTGRGVQLWWAIVPCYGGSDYGKSLYHYNKIKSNFMDHIETLLDEYSELDGLDIDRAPSSNVVGYFRLPCTYNTTAQCHTTLEIVHTKRFDQRELTKIAGVMSEDEDSEPTNLTPRSIPMKESDRFILCNFQSTGVRRVLQLIKLRNLRNNLVGSEMRDHFNFSVYNALRMKFDHHGAMPYLRAFNAGFKEPMTERELQNCVSTAMKKGGYKYTNLKLIDFLEVTPEEQRAIGLLPFSRKHATKPNASRDAVRKALKEDRDDKILELARKGVAQAEIARILGIGKNTVWRVMKRLREAVENAVETVAEVISFPSDGDSSRHQNGSLYVKLLHPILNNKEEVSDINEALFPIPIGNSS